MADLDELQIKITSSSKDAEEAISRLTRGLNDLSDALGKIDASKINSFANAMTKLANIGNNTNTTAKAIKSISNEIASSFGIRTKKGIEDITLALQELYKSARNVNMSNTPENNEAYFKNLQNLQDVIEANFKYKESVDETTKAIHEYVKAQNQSGSKVAMADMAKEYGENFKEVAKVLGKSFNNTLKSTEGALDLVKFFEDMNAALGTTFKVDNDQELKQSLDDLVRILQNAKDKVYDFSEAVASGLLTGEEAANSAYAVADRLFALIKEQDKYGASSGLGGLTEVFREISNMQMPDMTGVAEALRAAQSASGASKGINDIAKSSQKAASDVQELQNALMVVSQNTELMSKNDSTSLTVFEKMLPAVREVSAFQPPDLSTAIEQFNEYADAINRALNGMKAIEDKRLGLPDKYYDPIDTTGEWVENNPPDNFFAVDKFAQMERAAEGARRATDRLGDSIKYIEDQFGRPIDTTGEWVDNTPFKETAENAQKAGEAVKNAKEQMSGSSMADVLEPLIALGEGLEKLAHQFDSIGDKGIRIFQILTTPLKMAAEEYVEKFENMKSTIEGFRKHFQTKMTKLSQFWKRTMKTFTFMLVRKAITAVIEEVGKAVQSLAMYSNAMGTAFNTDVSHMVADFQYLGRSIVSVFAPLLNYIVPIIDAIVDRIATLISYIGMLFAALGGSASFTKAKKNIGNYAESLDQASKSAKNLTMGIDELNILSENKSGGSAKPYDGWEDAWEEVKIPQWIKDVSDWLKDFWKKFFDPLLEAWRRAKQYLIDGFKTMIDALKTMFGHIIDDFLNMWNQEKTIRMFEQILRIAGDLMRVVRNLANQFDKAWQKGKVGLKIFENLRDILAIVVDHVRNVSYYMIGWADEIDFYPMLEAFEKLTRQLKPLADFIGGVFEDIMINGVLKYIEFMIQDAIPHLMETIGKIVDAFNFPKLRSRLQPVWTEFEETLERIHTGTTNALGNIGVAFANFVNSDEFGRFLERLTELAREITAERVEKVLTGLGEGILRVAEAVIKFVNSDLFMKFIKAIGEWIDKKSTKEIAGVLEKLAFAIAGFKFAAFATNKLAGFFKFFSVIVSMKKLSDIAKGMSGVATATEAVGKAAPSVGLLYNPLMNVGSALSHIPGHLQTTIGAFKNLSTIGARGIFVGIASSVNDIAASLPGVIKLFGSLGTAFLEFKGVSSSIGEITKALSGDNNASLVGGIGKLIATVGAAIAAFSLLLGFPAGIIAAGVVAAVAAIKGLTDTVNQINLDNVFDAVMTQGEITVSQVGLWYDEATAKIDESINKWKDTARNLTQEKSDIQEYSQTLEGLTTVFLSYGDNTMLEVDQLTNKYKDLLSAIKNYINESNNSMIQNILLQADMLKANGYNVIELIKSIQDRTKDTVGALDEAMAKLDEAHAGFDGLTEGSDEWNAQMDIYRDALEELSRLTGQYSDALNDVDTSEAVSEIKKLQGAINLSDYDGNWEQAAKDIAEQIDKVTRTYQEKANEIDIEKDRLLEAYRANPDMDDTLFAALELSLTESAEKAKEKLATASGEVLDYYSEQLSGKMDDVASKAQKDWEGDKSPFRFMTKGSQSAYALNQMDLYVEKMFGGENGLGGKISRAYDKIPGVVNPHVEESMRKILSDGHTAYRVYGADSANVLRTFQEETWQHIVDGAKDVDIDKVAEEVAGKEVTVYQEKANSAFEAADMAQTGTLYNEKVGDAITEQSEPLNSAVAEVAEKSADLFNNAFEAKMSENSALLSTLKDYGAASVVDFAQGISNEVNKGTVGMAVINLFTKVNTVMKQQVDTLKTSFKAKLTEMFNLSDFDVKSPISTLFQKVTDEVTNNLNVFGANLLGNILPTFMQTYIFPFFNVDMWQPLFDNLFNMVFVPMFEQFKTWFSESMTAWWEDGLLPWFDSALWDEDVFTPLKENIQEHWETFSSWWDTTMSEWWENQVKPWFAKDFWKEQLTNILEVTKEVFDLIKEAIKLRMDEAAEAVEEACQSMTKSIEDVMTAVDDMLEKLGSFEGFNGDVTFSFGAKEFAQGGFPSRGSLFWAGETGAGAEMVGNIGGKTGVVSNGEITGIADAVYATGNNESELLAQLISIGQAMLNKDPIVLGDKEIARMANSGQSKLGMSIIS